LSGAALILGAQLAFAVGALFLKKLTGGTSPYLAAALMLAVAAAATAPLLVFRLGDLRGLNTQQLGWAVLASLFWFVIGEMLFSAGMAATTLSRASVLMLTLPLFSTVLAVAFLGEAITLRSVVAAALVCGGAALLLGGEAPT
jgi:drug/metabolite transporter (DMT)-like permease